MSNITICNHIGKTKDGKLYPHKLLPIIILIINATNTINRSSSNTPQRGKYAILIQWEKISEVVTSLICFITQICLNDRIFYRINDVSYIFVTYVWSCWQTHSYLKYCLAYTIYIGGSVLVNGLLVRYARPQNAHLRQVNSAFSGFASLEISLVIQHLKEEAVATKLLDSLFAVFIVSSLPIQIAYKAYT